jgi:protein-disulfide isomerase
VLAVAGIATKLATPAAAYHDGLTIDDDEMVLGQSDAPITVIEYSSLTCPHCANFHLNTLPDIRANYVESGKVRLVYRHFPFDQPALMAAALAECAGPDRFFSFIDALYDSQLSWARAADPIAALTSIGRLGGLGPDAIAACFNDRALLDRILAHRVEGAKEFGVESTPTFIVNGEKLVGALPYAQFEDVFERLLSKG